MIKEACAFGCRGEAASRLSGLIAIYNNQQSIVSLRIRVLLYPACSGLGFSWVLPVHHGHDREFGLTARRVICGSNINKQRVNNKTAGDCMAGAAAISSESRGATAASWHISGTRARIVYISGRGDGFRGPVETPSSRDTHSLVG